MNHLIDYEMNPSHLDEAEIDYELIIRGAEREGTHRTKVVALKRLLNEVQPVVNVTLDEESFTRCTDKLNDLQKKLKLEIGRNLEEDILATKSKIKHHIDKAYRLAEGDSQKILIINGIIQSFVRIERLSLGSGSPGSGSYRATGKASPEQQTLGLGLGRGRGTRRSVSKENLYFKPKSNLETVTKSGEGPSGIFNPKNVTTRPNVSYENASQEPVRRQEGKGLEDREPQANGAVAYNPRTNVMDTWKVSFSGEDKVSLTDFLWRVEMYAQADRVNKSQLHRGMFRLLKGSALEWFEVSFGRYDTWDELVRGMKARFLPSNYDFLMLEEILCRIQQPNESVATFFTHMFKLFQRIYPPLDETYKLYILRRNMSVQFSRQLTVVNINTVEELTEICKRFDEARLLEEKRCNTVQKSTPLEPQASHQWQFAAKSQNRQKVNTITESMEKLVCSEISNTSNTQRGNHPADKKRYGGRKCWNCGERGHGHFDCKQARTRIFCWVCGKEGVRADECKKNHTGVKSVAGVEPANSARDDSDPGRTEN